MSDDTGEPPPPAGPQGEAAYALAQLLREHRDEIVSRFVAAVADRDLSPPGVSRSHLVDHIPQFLDEVVEEITGATSVRMSQEIVDTSATARQHGEQRWSLGYDLGALVREYGILRHCIVQKVKEQGVRPSVDELDVLSKCLNVGVAQAVTEYTRHRDDQLAAQQANLAFLAEAGELLSSSLDYRSTLSRLTGLLVPRMADWCAVSLDDVSIEETPLAHVDAAKLEPLRDVYRRFPALPGSAYDHPPVTRTGEPRLVSTPDPNTRETSAQDPDHRALLRLIDTRSWIIVPLRIQGNTFGALTLAYADSRRRYAEHDLILAGEVARRAAVAIDNARLYAMSQNERSRVEASQRAKDEFVAMVSHELKTPLTAILGWLRLMREGALPDKKREHAFAVIERNANMQNQLVADLLDISRVMTGTIRISSAQVDLGDVVERAVESLRPAADAKRIELDVDVFRDDAVLRGDGDRLQQVAWNLVANAIKFTPKRGLVSVRLRKIASDLELAVVDNGAGIAPDFLPHVFENFQQADTSATRIHGGLGVGLSIAQHIVELHGGSITAQSEGVGRGATFVVRLPVSPVISTTLGVTRVAATLPPSAPSSLPKGLEGTRVLVVDDEPDAGDLVANVLETCGIEVRIATSAAEALSVLESFTPDVIISDIGMPGQDGYTLIRSIRTLPADDKKDIPAIALTAFSTHEDRTRALVEGFNRHLAKPVEPTTLMKAVVELAAHAPPRAPID